MKILFLERGKLWSYGLPDGLRDLGHTVHISGPVTETALVKQMHSFRPDLLISVGWGPDHTVYKQRLMRKLAAKYKIPLVYWSTEDPNFTNEFTLPLIKRMQPDYIFTISKQTAKMFRSLGYPSAYLDFAYHPNIHFRTKIKPAYRADIAVVANAYPGVLRRYPRLYRHRAIDILIKPLISSGYKVDFYGKDWGKMGAYLGKTLPKDSLRGKIPYKNANQVYSSAKIIIGLQNYKHMLTQRTYEILGSGGFLLTCNTPAVQRLLRSNYDAAISSSGQETLSLVRYYLNHDQERERIRRNGRGTISAENYKNRAAQLLSVLKDEGILS